MATYSPSGVDPRLAQKFVLTDPDGTVVPLSGGTVPVSGTISSTPTKAGTGTTTRPSAASSGASSLFLAANANRLGAAITNEGPATLILNLGATASTTAYTIQVAVNGYYETPASFTGAINQITASSTAQGEVTEFTA